MDKIRFGIVGMGVQGSLYAAILTGTPLPQFGRLPKPENCVLTAVSSRSAQSRERAEGMGAAWFADWKEMIGSGLCDAVIITVPHYLHHEVAVYALEQGLHVLCEKPAGVRASDVRKMLAAQNGKALGMILNQRTNPLFRRLKELVDSGELGSLRRSNWICNSWWRPDSYYATNPWRGTWKGEGGGILVNQLPHQLDLWLGLAGMPEEVYCLARQGAWRNVAVETDVTVTARYPTGATGVLVSCTHDPLGTDRLELDFDQGKIVVEGSTKATVYRFRQPEQVWNETVSHMEMVFLSRTPEALYTAEEVTAAQPFGEAYAEIFRNFAAHIISGEPLIADGEAGLRQVQLANAIALSGWKNEPVKVPCNEQEYNEKLQNHIDSEG